MHTLNLKLTLVDDLVASERPATEGGHASLDYLPGAMLLGAAAAELYADLSRGDAHILFHSGRVRFGDGLPLEDEVPGWPMPLCWHERKEKSATHGRRLVPDKMRNLQFGRFGEGEQAKQIRDDHVRVDGLKLSIRKSMRMKTAIDPDTGRVAESQLFGYETISAGQSFAARVEADEELPESLWERLVGALTARGELLLGRSRSAEYGRVRVALIETPIFPLTGIRERRGKEMTLWCLSDVALLDRWGQPTLEPSPESLGLGTGKIRWDRTFLRFRRYAPWNAHRRGPDLERQVIRRGSVIALELDAVPDGKRYEGLAAGIGLHRESGLGRVWVDPPLLAGEYPEFEPVIEARIQTDEMPTKPDHPLIAWLEKRSGGDKRRLDAEKQARELAVELAKSYRLARAFAGLEDGLPIGPSPSQWGSVYEKAKSGTNLGALKQTLFEEGDGVCKPEAEGWRDSFRDEHGVRRFAVWFEESSDGLGSLRALRVFCREAQRIAQSAHGRNDHGGKSA